MKRLFNDNHVIPWMCLTFIYSICFTFGKMFDKYGFINWDGINDIVWIVLGIIIGIPLAFGVTFVNKKIANKKEVVEYETDRKMFYRYFFISLVCYLVIILGIYPGFFVYDAQDELMQVITRNFNAHHPILHVLYMGGVVQAGYKIFGDYNSGIFLFTLFQSILFSYTNARIAIFISDKTKSNVAGITSFIYLLAFPPLEMMALCSTKDSIFSICVALWVINYFELKNKVDIWSIFKLIFWTSMMCMFRNNAMYALLVFCLLLLVYREKKYACLLFIGIIISITLNTGLVWVSDAKSVGKQEMLTVPIQQITRYYNYSNDGDGFSPEEKEILYTYLPEEFLLNYNPKVSDMVKYGFSNDKYDEDPSGFWKLWYSGLKRSPLCYINAWMMTCYGYWYPNAIIDAYKGNQVFTFQYDKSSYFGYETELPGVRHSKIPLIDDYFRYLSLERVKDDSKIISLILSPGLIVWVYLFLLWYMIIYKKNNELPCILLILIIMTLMLGPICLPRYVFYLWYILPVMIIMGMKRGKL